MPAVKLKAFGTSWEWGKAHNMLRKILLALFIIGIAASFAYWQMFSAVDSDSEETRLFQIYPGDDSASIARRLEDDALIRSDRTFALFAKIRGYDKQIKHGRYRLSAGFSLTEVLHAIAEPELVEVSVTIPEGFSVFDIDERLSAMGLILPGEFSSMGSGLEGYLFPDTYFVYGNNFNPESLVKKMQENFLVKVTPDLLEETKKRKRTIQEVITIASILEKEVKTKKDYAIVSGILWKRLDANWPIQADATLLYGKKTPMITAAELSENTPYNTYKKRGLPPTPISNPGLATIRAAIFPEDSSYWFYLTDREGNVHYAKTNEEQNKNRRKFL